MQLNTQILAYFTGQVERDQVYCFLGPNNDSIVKITSNNKMAENMLERKKFHVTYCEVKYKSITLQCFSEKQNYHVSNSCVTVVGPSKDKR